MTLDSDTLLIPAWPGADHSDKELAAMAAMIRRPGLRRFTGDRLSVSWSAGSRTFAIRRWHVGTPEQQFELRLEPDQLRWFRKQLWDLSHGEEPRSYSVAGGRVLTLTPVQHRGEPGLRLRTVGLPGGGFGWVETLCFSVRDLRTLVNKLVSARGTLDEE